MPRRIVSGGWAAALLLSLLGCSPDSFDSVEDRDLVLSVRRPSHDFGEYKTYAMPEEVRDLGDLVEDPIEIDHSFDRVILDTIARQMADMGYTRVADPESDEADVVVEAGGVASNTWVIYGYYPWWGHPGYWWWFPPVRVPVAYPTGSLAITMLDKSLAEKDEEGRDVVPVIWISGIRGLLANNQNNTAVRVESLIQQAFKQSDYLRVGSPVPPQTGLDGGIAGDGGMDDDGGME